MSSMLVVSIQSARAVGRAAPEDADARFAETLETAIEVRGSVARVAQHCDVTRSSVYQWRNGDTKNLKNANYFAVCEAADINPVWTATGKGLKHPYQYAADIVATLDAIKDLNHADRADQGSQPR